MKENGDKPWCWGSCTILDVQGISFISNPSHQVHMLYYEKVEVLHIPLPHLFPSMALPNKATPYVAVNIGKHSLLTLVLLSVFLILFLLSWCEWLHPKFITVNANISQYSVIFLVKGNGDRQKFIYLCMLYLIKMFIVLLYRMFLWIVLSTSNGYNNIEKKILYTYYDNKNYNNACWRIKNGDLV